MSALTKIRLTDAIKEVFESDPGPHHWSAVAKRIEALYPDAFALHPSTLEEQLEMLESIGFLKRARGEHFGYFQKG